MTYTFKLARRLARFRTVGFATILTLAGCNGTDSLDPSTGSPAATEQASPVGPQLASATFAGGIPFGTFAQPVTAFGARFNGAQQNNGPDQLLSALAEVKARGGRVAIVMAGNNKYYKDAAGHFDFAKWKGRIDRFKSVNFSSYITDGTIIGHYMIDEPNDPSNWNGVPVPGTTVDAMAQYSKSIWPTMATIARVEPGYFPLGMKYLDAAWAQYLARRGNVNDYIKRSVSDAQARGLTLIVGLNLLDGGTPNMDSMTASEVDAYGTALLSSSYPCAFISWHYEDSYLSTPGMGTAMDRLRSMAQNRGTRSCSRSSAGSTPPPPPPPPPPPSDTTTPPPADSTPSTPPPPATGALPFSVFQAPSSAWTGGSYRADPAEIVSRLTTDKSRGVRTVVSLAWPARVKNADGTFNLTKWKAQVDRFRNLSLGQFVTSRTFYAHLVVDQPNCAACWGGTAIPWATVEAMAKYSKAIWPALPTVAKAPPTVLANATFRWSYLDAGWAMYSTRQGDLRSYLASQATAARNEGLGLMVGLNLIDAAGANTAAMTASQILQLGTVAAKEPSACALVGWRYDASYVGQTAIRAALDSVAKVARSRSAGACVVN
jgi:hypothetical protein